MVRKLSKPSKQSPKEAEFTNIRCVVGNNPDQVDDYATLIHHRKSVEGSASDTGVPGSGGAFQVSKSPEDSEYNGPKGQANRADHHLNSRQPNQKSDQTSRHINSVQPLYRESPASGGKINHDDGHPASNRNLTNAAGNLHNSLSRVATNEDPARVVQQQPTIPRGQNANSATLDSRNGSGGISSQKPQGASPRGGVSSEKSHRTSTSFGSLYSKKTPRKS